MEKSFETTLAELEQIVTRLEDGDLPLEESMELFEQGIRLSRECRERLVKAERRIEILMKDANENLSTAEIDPDDLRVNKNRTANYTPRSYFIFGQGLPAVLPLCRPSQTS